MKIINYKEESNYISSEILRFIDKAINLFDIVEIRYFNNESLLPLKGDIKTIYCITYNNNIYLKGWNGSFYYNVDSNKKCISTAYGDFYAKKSDFNPNNYTNLVCNIFIIKDETFSNNFIKYFYNGVYLDLISNTNTIQLTWFDFIWKSFTGFTIAELRLLTDSQISLVNSFSCKEITRLKDWYYDSSDTTSADNDLDILVTTTGKRLKARKNQWINIEAFGISSSDSDIATKLQTLIDNGYRRLEAWNNTYNISSVTLRDATIIRGNATLFHITSATSPLFKTNSTTTPETIKLIGLTFDGNKANRRSSHITDTPQQGCIISTNSSYKTLEIKECKFTNSVISAVTVAGTLKVQQSKFFNQSQHGTNAGEDTYCIFAQPTSNISRLNITIEDCLYQAESESLADLIENSGGIFITQEQNGYGRYESVLINNNRFYGTSSGHQPNVLGAVDTYNGVRRPIITNNFFENIAFSAIKVQRSENAIITGNEIYNVTNNSEKDCFPILFEPQAREGESPYTGSRLGEVLYNAIISNNIIDTASRHGIVVRGSDVLVEGNIIRKITASTGGVLQVISIEKSYVDVVDNIISDCDRNVIYLPASYTNVNVRGNRYRDITTASTGNLFIATNGLANSIWRDNSIDCLSGATGIGLSIRGGNNVKVLANIVNNKSASFDVRSASTKVTFENNIATSVNAYTPYTESSDCNLIEQRTNNWNPIINFAIAIPTTGNWTKGSIIYNTNPFSGGYVGWICTTSGTPGIWEKFGKIENNNFDVKWFGAKGDLSQDDYIYIQATINYVINLGKGNILLSKGNYSLSQYLKIESTVNNPVSLIGEGKNISVLYPTFTTGNCVLKIGVDDAKFFDSTYKDFSISGSGISQGTENFTHAVIWGLGLHTSQFENISIFNFYNSTAIQLQSTTGDCYGNELANIYINNCKNGLETLGNSDDTHRVDEMYIANFRALLIESEGGFGIKLNKTCFSRLFGITINFNARTTLTTYGIFLRSSINQQSYSNLIVGTELERMKYGIYEETNGSNNCVYHSLDVSQVDTHITGFNTGAIIYKTGQFKSATSGTSNFNNVAFSGNVYTPQFRGNGGDTVFGNSTGTNYAKWFWQTGSGELVLHNGGTPTNDGNRLQIDGNISLKSIGNGIKMPTGSGSPKGSFTLSSGTSTSIAVTGMSTSSNVQLTLESVGGTVTSTWQYKVTKSAGSFIITAITNTGSTNTLDTSTIGYYVTI